MTQEMDSIRTITLTNGLTIEMILIPSGDFQMGSAVGEEPEKPVHDIRITRPFYLGKYQVTKEQWEAVTGRNPSEAEQRGAKRPVDSVSWDDITEEFLPKVQRYAPGGWSFRLPTEAEWEYACRAGTDTVFFFGDDAGELGEYCWYAPNSDCRTHDVGTKKPNPWGFHDMLGNVYEWVEDWYDERFYDRTPRQDPCNTTPAVDRMARGGADFKNDCRPTERRHGQPPDFRNGSFGFRLAMSQTD